MTIKSILDKLNTLERKGDIVVFEGFTDEDCNKVTWTDKNIRGYFKLLERINPVCIAYFLLDFDIEEEVTFDDLELINNNSNTRAGRLYKSLKTRTGDLKTINISAITNGFSFDLFRQDDKLIEMTEELKILIQELREKEEEKKFKKITIQDRAKIADQIASSYDYFKNITRPQEIDKLINKVLLEYGIEISEIDYRTRWDLKDRVSSKFDKKYKEKHEKDIIETIRSYKEAGMSKNEMISRLGITKGILDKYYYL